MFCWLLWKSVIYFLTGLYYHHRKTIVVVTVLDCGLQPVHDSGAADLKYVNPNRPCPVSGGRTYSDKPDGGDDARDVCGRHQRQAYGGEKMPRANWTHEPLKEQSTIDSNSDVVGADIVVGAVVVGKGMSAHCRR